MIGLTGRRAFCRVMAGAAGALVIDSSVVDAARGVRQDRSPRRQVVVGGRRIRVIDTHAHCVIPVQDVVTGTPLANVGAVAETTSSARSGSPSWTTGRRRSGAEHQRLLVVRGRSGPGAAYRASAERGARQVGGDAPGPLRRAGVGRAAASRAGRRAARGRRQASRPPRRLDWRPRKRRGSLASEVRPVLGQGRRARRAGLHAPRRGREHRQRRRVPRPRAISATSSAIRSRPRTSCRG